MSDRQSGKQSPRPSPGRAQTPQPATRSRRNERARQKAEAQRRQNLAELKRLRAKEKKTLRKRVSGRPKQSDGSDSLPQILYAGLSRVLKLALVIVLIAGFLLLGLGLGMLSGYIATATPLEVVDIRYTNEPTEIKDRKGNVVAVLTGAQNIEREYIQLSRIRQTYLEEAFKAIEDERFDTHNGIDPRRIGSAVLSMLANAGTPTHGGSTITQQVVKMMSGADEESAQRKIQEWYRALDLEKRLSKDEIMELYINIVPMGGNYIGVQAAAKAYFDKEASELDLAECAFLAGIPNLPSIYNPKTEYGRRNGLRRMRITLEKMFELDMVTEDEYTAAMNRELIFRQQEPTITSTQINSWFVDAAIDSVIADLISRRGYSEQLARQAVYQQGLTIELTMDPKVQKAAEETFMKKELFASNVDALPDIPEPPQSSITILSNNPSERGQIVGMVGGFGKKTGNFQFNRATHAYRQPGSSIKPILVYAPAMNAGAITAATLIDDTVRYLDNQNPDIPYPLNVTRTYEGVVTARHALAWSINTVAAEIYANVLSPQIGMAYLKELGIDRSAELQVAASLGGLAHGVTTYEMAGAYSALANEGLYTKPYYYTRVLDLDGNILLENKPQFSQVFSPETAFIMSDILYYAEENVSWQQYSRISGQMVAGKTGTTNDVIDTWFCGYTPYYTAACWYGYDNSDGRRTEILDEDRYNSQRIWQDVMARIHEGLAPSYFVKPDSVVDRTVCGVSGYLVGPYCPSHITEWFDATKSNIPTQQCPYHLAPSPTPSPVPEPTVETLPPEETAAEESEAPEEPPLEPTDGE